MAGQGGERRMRRRDMLRLIVAGAGAMATGALLAACGGTASPTAGATANAASTAAGTVGASVVTSGTAVLPGYPNGGKYSALDPVGKRGGHITELSTNDPKTVNPMLASDGPSLALVFLMFNFLVGVNPDTGLPFPDLAVDVPTTENGGLSADGLTYIFHLRPGVTWHDGQPLTARDVVFTYTTLAKKELGSSRTSGVVDRIESVTAPDDATAVFRLKRAIAPFLALTMYPIVPEHILRDVPVDQIKNHPFSTDDPKATIGTGPFTFKEYVPSDHATLVKNPAYFRGAPALDQYVVKYVKDSSTAAAQLKTGEADYAGNSGGVTAAGYDDLKKQAGLNVVTYDTYATTQVAMQLDPTKTPLFQDRSVRQALMYALDRETMEQKIAGGLGTVAQGTIPAASWAYAPDQIAPRYTYDPKKAEQLLGAAGWTKGADGIRAKDGKRFSFTLYAASGDAVRTQQASVMQESWKQIGLDCKVQMEEFSVFIARITGAQRDFDMFLVAYTYTTDPDQTTTYASNGGTNTGKYTNPRVDALLAEGLSELDHAKRKQVYIQMENIVWNDLPILILDYPQGIETINRRVHNIRPNATNVRWNAHTWWVADGT